MAKKTVEKEQRDSISFEEQGGAARQDVTNSSGRNLEVVSEGAHSLKDKRTQRKKMETLLIACSKIMLR